MRDAVRLERTFSRLEQNSLVFVRFVGAGVLCGSWLEAEVMQEPHGPVVGCLEHGHEGMDGVRLGEFVKNGAD